MRNIQSLHPKQTKLNTKNKECKGDSFRLDGLLDIIKTNNKDASMLSLGLDLTTLNMDLTNTEPLHTSFVSPWGDATNRLDQLIPPCYNLPKEPPNIQSKITSFSEDTLLYLFYAGTNIKTDNVQTLAALELQKRDWLWNPQARLWVNIKKADRKDTDNKEQTKTCAVFDPVKWEKVHKDILYEKTQYADIV